MKSDCPFCAAKRQLTADDTERFATVNDLAQGIAATMICCATAWIPESDRAEHLNLAGKYLAVLADVVPSPIAAEAMHCASQALSAQRH